MQAIPENITKNRVQASALGNMFLFLALVGLTAWVASRVFGFSTDERWTVAWGAVWILALVGAPLEWYRAHARRGSLLLDLGPHPQRRSNVLWGVWFLLMLVAGAFDRFDLLFPYGSWAVGLTTAIVLGSSGMGRVQFREGGIWNSGGLVPWSKIEGYDLVGGDMRFRVRRAFLWPNWVSFAVDSETWDDAARFVEARIGSGAMSPSAASS